MISWVKRHFYLKRFRKVLKDVVALQYADLDIAAGPNPVRYVLGYDSRGVFYRNGNLHFRHALYCHIPLNNELLNAWEQQLREWKHSPAHDQVLEKIDILGRPNYTSSDLFVEVYPRIGPGKMFLAESAHLVKGSVGGLIPEGQRVWCYLHNDLEQELVYFPNDIEFAQASLEETCDQVDQA